MSTIDIENVGEDEYILRARGHHDVHEFMKQVRADGYDWPLGMPRHVWMRTVPTREPGYKCMYHEAKQGARGAYPVTYAYEAWGDELYENIIANEKAKP